MSDPKEGYDLRTAVFDVLDTSDLTDFQAIAAKVAENVPARQLRAALGECLVSYVRMTCSQRRMANPVLHTARSARSPKVAAIRDAHAKWLRELISVEGGQKFLGECTYEDLMFAAEKRRKHAAVTVAQAQRFEEIAALLHEHQVETVAELPPSALMEVAA